MYTVDATNRRAVLSTHRAGTEPAPEETTNHVTTKNQSRSDRPKRFTVGGVTIAYTMYGGRYRIRRVESDNYAERVVWEISEGHDSAGVWLSPTYFSPIDVEWTPVDDHSLTLREAVAWVQHLNTRPAVYPCKQKTCRCKPQAATND